MQGFWLKGGVWLLAEVFLTFVELDNLADYGEFIFRLRDELAYQRDRVERVLWVDGVNPLDGEVRGLGQQPWAILGWANLKDG